jgi:hypothetical protein
MVGNWFRSRERRQFVALDRLVELPPLPVPALGFCVVVSEMSFDSRREHRRLACLTNEHLKRCVDNQPQLLEVFVLDELLKRSRASLTSWSMFFRVGGGRR